MSLKAVHLVFVTVISSLALGCGVWQLRTFRSPEGSHLNLVIGLAALLAGAVMIVYGRYFLKKLKNVSYL
jgi:uncharacterized membrane protein